MRRFVFVGHELPTTPEFPLDALASEAGRLDLLARCLLSAFLVSHGLREDVRAYVVVRDEYVLRFEGAELQGLHPDERSTAARVRDAIEAGNDAIGAEELESAPGIYATRGDFADALDAVDDGTLVALHEDGDSAVDVDPPADPVFVLSDHREFTDAEADLLAERADHRLRLGPTALHADDAVAVAHNWLDTEGFTAY
ncbi:tRNA (pseudouridine(54)-N(1))-methyltransferase TrmY [Halobacteriales archaeon QS_1_68_20]|nr:MAG: tRNA (pseudouridine(54)-N(1))-methyltransferase TrmY [Halobacteriales archaeon QS_1_68_20]